MKIYEGVYFFCINTRLIDRKSNNVASETLTFLFFSFKPVGFVTFHTRAGAEAAKQDLQVLYIGFSVN